MAREQPPKTCIQLRSCVVEIDTLRRGGRGRCTVDCSVHSTERALGDRRDACQERFQDAGRRQRQPVAASGASCVHIGTWGGLDFNGVPLDHIVMLAARLAQRKRVKQQSFDLVGHAGLPGAGVSDQLVGASQQVREACLVARLSEAAVRRPPGMS